MNRPAAFAEWFGIAPAQAALLDALYAANGFAVPHEDLCRRFNICIGALRQRAYALHEAMEPGSIICLTGVGYRLTSMGLRDCEDALADAARREIAA
jgi:hypothetical protein